MRDTKSIRVPDLNSFDISEPRDTFVGGVFQDRLINECAPARSEAKLSHLFDVFTLILFGFPCCYDMDELFKSVKPIRQTILMRAIIWIGFYYQFGSIKVNFLY